VSPELRAWLLLSRAASGVPPKVEDPEALAHLAALLQRARAKSSETKARAA
jgi:hypothetical protein